MAVFLLKSKLGAAHVPPGCAGIFGDVPCPSLFADWVEELYALGVTGGCNTSPLLYCPSQPVTRAQMGATNVIYERDLAMHLTVTNIHVWTVADPYTGSDTITQLYQLGNWWHANRPIATDPRTYVHYLSGHPVSEAFRSRSGFLLRRGLPGHGHGLGRRLWPDAGLRTTRCSSGTRTRPRTRWDTTSAPLHTHCLFAADRPLGLQSRKPAAYSGPVENQGAGNGTIMSYCPPARLAVHVPGVSPALHLGAAMMPGINGASCLTIPVVFADVLPSDPFLSYIDTVYNDGITSGCGTDPLRYCPRRIPSPADRWPSSS